MSKRELPDLSKLDGSQKDVLILSLWETLQAIEGTQPPPAAVAAQTDDGARTSTGALRERIRASAPSRRSDVSMPGARNTLLRVLDYRPLRTVILLIALGFLVDLGIGWNQQRQLATRDRAIQRLNEAAFGGLYVEMTKVAYEPGSASYRATLNMQNSRHGEPVYVMLNAVRIFVQSGLTWQEVPSRPPAGTIWGVVKLDDAREYSVVFETDLKDWTELIPGYMHVLVQSDMLISQRSDPTDDIVERNNRFYFYLKPQGADDAGIKRRSNFPGDPPIFIPMPPH